MCMIDNAAVSFIKYPGQAFPHGTKQVPDQVCLYYSYNRY